MNWDDEELLRLRREERLSLARIGERLGCSSFSVRRRLIALGEPTHGPGGEGTRRWSDEDMLAALRAWRDRTGVQPSMTAWRTAREVPCSSAIAKRFGSWSNALIEAGMDGRIMGDWRTYEQRDAFDDESAALQARVDAGQTLTEIAWEIGVTPQSLGRRLARWRDANGGEHRCPLPGDRRVA